MPRPTNKEALLTTAQDRFDKMWALINTLEPNATLNTKIVDYGKEAHWKRDKNVRDILIHLHEWHGLALNWVKANRNGSNQPFLPEPYTWKTYGDMNIKFWEAHQATSYPEAEKSLKTSHQQVLALIDTLSNDELFTKKHFPWTGTTNLASYFISATSSHYDWAIKKLKAHIKLSGD
jgi:hypothetical protein